MGNQRDDFTAATKELLAKRVGCRCSNPNCRKSTIGPGSEAGKTVNIGVAAHITAAAEGGPRYDPDMTAQQRKDGSNGIWLCQSCAKLIDSDVIRYPAGLLQMWKHDSEEKTAMELECRQILSTVETGMEGVRSDVERMRFYIQCIDRPAFHDQLSGSGAIRSMRFDSNQAGLVFRRHDRNLSAFEKAIEDTIIALNTGILRTRDGDVLMRSQGKSQVVDPEWNQKMKEIVEILTWMRHSLAERRNRGMEYVMDEKYLSSLEEARQKVVEIMNAICRQIGLNELS